MSVFFHVYMLLLQTLRASPGFTALSKHLSPKGCLQSENKKENEPGLLLSDLEEGLCLSDIVETKWQNLVTVWKKAREESL